jgi:hypothetical protein
LFNIRAIRLIVKAHISRDISQYEGENVQVLEVTTREINVRNDLDLSFTDLGDLYGLAEVSDTAINLDLILEELLERGDVEDLVGGWLGSVDDELPIC